MWKANNTRPPALRVVKGVVGRLAVSLVAVVLVLSAITTPASADDTGAEGYFIRGNQLFDQGEYEEAARMFRVASVLRPDLPGPYRRLGQTLLRLEQCEEAVEVLNRYLEIQPEGRFAPQAREDLEQCTARLPAPPSAADAVPGQASGFINITSSIDGAAVTVDNVTVGTAPIYRLEVDSGPRSLTVTRDGYAPWEVVVEVRPGTINNLRANLVRDERARTGKGRLLLDVNPPGTAVYLDGTFMGTTPIGFIELDEGSWDVRLEDAGQEEGSPGAPSQHHEVHIYGGRDTLLTAELATGASPPGDRRGRRRENRKETLNGDRGRPGATSREYADPLDEHLTKRTGSNRKRMVGLTAIATGATATAGGLFLGKLAMDRQKTYQDAGPNTDRRPLKEEGERYARLADYTTGAGAALLLGGAILVLTNPRQDSTPDPFEGLDELSRKGDTPNKRPGRMVLIPVLDATGRGAGFGGLLLQGRF